MSTLEEGLKELDEKKSAERILMSIMRHGNKYGYISLMALMVALDVTVARKLKDPETIKEIQKEAKTKKGDDNG